MRVSRRNWRIPTGTSSFCDEAHKMVGHVFGSEGEIHQTLPLGQLLGQLTRHLLLMTRRRTTASRKTFNSSWRCSDSDRFEGRSRDGVHTTDVSDLMRRLVKEQLLKFDGKPLFPERRAYTVGYKLSDAGSISIQERHRLRPRGIQSRGLAGERRPQGDRRICTNDSATATGIFPRGDSTIPPASPRTSRTPSTRRADLKARSTPSRT